MSLRINNNVESLNAHRHLINNDKQLSKSIERLSSGQKINRGADGPASLVISEGMRAQIGSLRQATDNNEAAISLVQTAEGALNEVSKLLVDMRQRAVSAANLGINDQNSVNASQKEIENALEAIDRISNNTQFGSKNLLDGSALDADGNPLVSFQIGANKGQIASVSLPNVATNQLATGVSNDSGFSSLADLDVTTGKGAEDAMGVIDKAIEEIAVARGDLGAFQKNALESNLNSLRIAEENLTSAESTIRDADVAQQMSQLTGDQIMLSANTAMIAQANQVPRTVLGLIENSSF